MGVSARTRIPRREGRVCRRAVAELHPCVLCFFIVLILAKLGALVERNRCRAQVALKSRSVAVSSSSSVGLQSGCCPLGVPGVGVGKKIERFDKK